MTNAPAHAAEHEQLLQLLAKATRTSTLIGGIVLITVGVDGRPCVGGDLDTPEQILSVIRQLAAAENLIDTVAEVNIPEDN